MNIAIRLCPLLRVFERMWSMGLAALKKRLAAIGFVDKIIFGMMNYSIEGTAYYMHKDFFNNCAAHAVMFCDDRGIT